MGIGHSLQQVVLGKLDTTCERMNLAPYLTPCTGVNSKKVNERPKTIKFLEENIGEKLNDIEFGNNLLAMTPKGMYETGSKKKKEKEKERKRERKEEKIRGKERREKKREGKLDSIQLNTRASEDPIRVYVPHTH